MDTTQRALVQAAMAIKEALAILDLPSGAEGDLAALKKAYRSASRKHHPDLGGDVETMKKVNEAYELLSQGEAGTDDNDDDNDAWSGKKAIDILNDKLTPFKKGHAWWLPPYNAAINTALSNINVWQFTILPMLSAAYREAKKGKPEGLIIDPDWASVRGLDIAYGDIAKLNRLIEKLPTLETIEGTVKAEITFIEERHGIQVPPAVRAYLMKEMPKAAVRRWGTNRLRRKKILVPFDGSKPIELGSWD